MAEEALFSFLTVLSFFVLFPYVSGKGRKSAIYLFFTALVVFLTVNYFPNFGIFFILLLILPLFIEVPFQELITFSLFGTIGVSNFIMNFFLIIDAPVFGIISKITGLGICILAIQGIFERDIKKYLMISNIVQLFFVILDLAVLRLSPGGEVLKAVQIFNYTIAGSLLFLTIGALSRNGKTKFMRDLHGVYFKDRLDSTFAVIGSLSLAGLPALNMFVSEWFLFKYSYLVNPAITVLSIFAALLLFIMYFKTVTIILTGHKNTAIETRKSITFLNGILALLCILLGLFPGLQEYIILVVGG